VRTNGKIELDGKITFGETKVVNLFTLLPAGKSANENFSFFFANDEPQPGCSLPAFS
jgi:hypothetical protein